MTIGKRFETAFFNRRDSLLAVCVIETRRRATYNEGVRKNTDIKEVFDMELVKKYAVSGYEVLGSAAYRLRAAAAALCGRARLVCGELAEGLCALVETSRGGMDFAGYDRRSYEKDVFGRIDLSLQ